MLTSAGGPTHGFSSGGASVEPAFATALATAVGAAEATADGDAAAEADPEAICARDARGIDASTNAIASTITESRSQVREATMRPSLPARGRARGGVSAATL